MFETLQQRLRDASTIKTLCQDAQAHALARGQAEPGAEHFVLAALDLPDGTARQVFERLQLDPAQFGAAIEQQYASALADCGIDVADGLSDPPALAASGGLYRSQASAQALMDVLARQVVPRSRAAAGNPAARLVGAHVIAAASATPLGVVARSMQAMGCDSTRLAAAAAAVLEMN